jgi:hypothetical protein
LRIFFAEPLAYFAPWDRLGSFARIPSRKVTLEREASG